MTDQLLAGGAAWEERASLQLHNRQSYGSHRCLLSSHRRPVYPRAPWVLSCRHRLFRLSLQLLS